MMTMMISITMTTVKMTTTMITMMTLPAMTQDVNLVARIEMGVQSHQLQGEDDLKATTDTMTTRKMMTRKPTFPHPSQRGRSEKIMMIPTKNSKIISYVQRPRKIKANTCLLKKKISVIASISTFSPMERESTLWNERIEAAVTGTSTMLLMLVLEQHLLQLTTELITSLMTMTKTNPFSLLHTTRSKIESGKED